MRKSGAVKADQVVAAPGRLRPPLPERRDRHHDERSTCCPQFFWSEPNARKLARWLRKAFDDRVGRADKLQHLLGILCQVEHDAALTRVQIQVQATRLRVGPVARERPEPARRIALQWLDFDDFCAQIAQELRRVWPGDVLRQLDDAHSS